MSSGEARDTADRDLSRMRKSLRHMCFGESVPIARFYVYAKHVSSELGRHRAADIKKNGNNKKSYR